MNYISARLHAAYGYVVSESTSGSFLSNRLLARVCAQGSKILGLLIQWSRDFPIIGVVSMIRFFDCLHTVYRYCVSVSASGSLLPNPLDPRVYEQALKILGLSMQESQNAAVIKRKHELLIQVYTDRQIGLPSTLTQELGRWIRDAHIAYETVINHMLPDAEVLDQSASLPPNIEDID